MPQPTPLDRLAPWLRRRVADLRLSTMRRSFAVSVETVQSPLPTTGEPRHHRWQHDGRSLDHGLRVDLLCRLMSGLDGPAAVVVVRPSHHAERGDDDLAWAGAARMAAQVCGLPLAGVIIVSRWGWLDLVSGHHRDWKRLRIR